MLASPNLPSSLKNEHDNLIFQSHHHPGENLVAAELDLTNRRPDEVYQSGHNLRKDSMSPCLSAADGF